MKTCSVCGNSLSVDEFYKNPRSQDGLRYDCKTCIRTAEAQHREEHREVINAARRARYASNPVRERTRSNAWKRNHPEASRGDNHRRRVALHSGIVEKFIDTEIFERDDYICQICFEPIYPFLRWPDPLAASLDHIIPISKGGNHTRDNAQVSHLRCNLVKGDRV
jgi:5-methylcytosine-specific restriction endonuclease McrA